MNTMHGQESVQLFPANLSSDDDASRDLELFGCPYVGKPVDVLVGLEPCPHLAPYRESASAGDPAAV